MPTTLPPNPDPVFLSVKATAQNWPRRPRDFMRANGNPAPAATGGGISECIGSSTADAIHFTLPSCAGQGHPHAWIDAGCFPILARHWPDLAKARAQEAA